MNRRKNYKAVKLPKAWRYCPRITIYRMIWSFNKYDDDDWPSVPHGHSQDKKYKLNVWTGEVFDRITKKTIGKASKKELSMLHGDSQFKRFAKETIQWHHKEHPEHQFSVPEWLMIETYKSLQKQSEIPDQFSVLLSVRKYSFYLGG